MMLILKKDLQVFSLVLQVFKTKIGVSTDTPFNILNYFKFLKTLPKVSWITKLALFITAISSLLIMTNLFP